MSESGGRSGREYFFGEVFADHAALVESESVGESYDRDFAPWMAIHVFFGLKV